MASRRVIFSWSYAFCARLAARLFSIAKRCFLVRGFFFVELAPCTTGVDESCRVCTCSSMRRLREYTTKNLTWTALKWLVNERVHCRQRRPNDIEVCKLTVCKHRHHRFFTTQCRCSLCVVRRCPCERRGQPFSIAQRKTQIPQMQSGR